MDPFMKMIIEKKDKGEEKQSIFDVDSFIKKHGDLTIIKSPMVYHTYPPT